MGDKDIGRLDVAVDDLAGMEIVDSVAEFARNLAEEGRGWRSNGEPLGKCLAVDEFHLDAIAEFRMAEVIESPADRGMIEAVSEVEFLAKEFFTDRILTIIRGKAFQDDQLPELACKPDLAVTAA